MALWWLAQELWLRLCILFKPPVHSTPFRHFLYSSSKSRRTIHARATCFFSCAGHVRLAGSHHSPSPRSPQLPALVKVPSLRSPQLAARMKVGNDNHRLPYTVQSKLQSTADTQVLASAKAERDGLSTIPARRASLSISQSRLTSLTSPSILLAYHDHPRPTFAGGQVSRGHSCTRPVSACRRPARRNTEAHPISGRADIEGSKSNVAMNAWLANAGLFFFFFFFFYRPRRTGMGAGGGMAPFRAGDWRCGSIVEPCP